MQSVFASALNINVVVAEAFSGSYPQIRPLCSSRFIKPLIISVLSEKNYAFSFTLNHVFIQNDLCNFRDGGKVL
jgi:hypothetical protein